MSSFYGNGGGGISNKVKAALLTCFQHVVWNDEHGQNYYNVLEKALNGSNGGGSDFVSSNVVGTGQADFMVLNS